MKQVPERLQFFLDRIGKTIYRNDYGCPCEICKSVVDNGLYINDEDQARYCYDCETEFTGEGTPLRYFDSKSDVEEWIKTLPK